MEAKTPLRPDRFRKPSITRLYGRSLFILGRDILHLATKVRQGPLNRTDAQSLAGYIRLLKDLTSLEEWLSKEVDKKLSKFSVEEIEEMAAKLLRKHKTMETR